MRKEYTYFFITCLFIGKIALGQTKNSSIYDALNSFKNDPKLQSASIGFQMLFENGEVIAQENQQKSLIPASSLKLITCFFALKHLGFDYKFQTEVFIKGKIEGSVLKGDLIISGSGDPTFGTLYNALKDPYPLLKNKILTQLKEKGVSKIEGDIIIDHSKFGYETIPDTWIWKDLGNYYAAPAAAVNIYNNTYSIFLQSSNTVGSKVKVLKTEPNVPDLKIINELKTDVAGSGDQAYIKGGNHQNEQIITGTIPINKSSFKIKGAIPNPGVLLRENLKEYLKVESIIITGGIKQSWVGLENKSFLCSVSSSPLSEIVKQTLAYSNNLYAEAILKQLALKAEKKATTQNGIEVLNSSIKKYGVKSGYQIADGSGLSSFNLLTPESVTTLLMKMKAESVFPEFSKLMPVIGRGRMKYLNKGSSVEGRILLKTGTMSRAKCFFGFYKSYKNEYYPFALFINNFEVRTSYVSQKVQPLFNSFNSNK